MVCPYCDRSDPEVDVVKDEHMVITGEVQVSQFRQKADVEVECRHCGGRFLLEFRLEASGPMIDLS